MKKYYLKCIVQIYQFCLYQAYLDFAHRSAPLLEAWGWLDQIGIYNYNLPEARANSTAIRQIKATARGLLAVGVVRGGSIRGGRYPRSDNRSECSVTTTDSKRMRQHDIIMVTLMITRNRVFGCLLYPRTVAQNISKYLRRGKKK